MKKLILIAACWLLTGLAFAQQLDSAFVADTQEDYDEIFSELDWVKITTGVLADKTLILSDLEAYNGTGEGKKAANFKEWQQLYAEFYNASQAQDNLQPRSQISAIGHSFLEEEQKIPLLMLAYNYNRFVPDAAALGLIEIDSLDTKKIYDRSDNQELYTEHQLFAVASASRGWNGGPVIFYIGHEFWFGNITVPPFCVELAQPLAAISGMPIS